MRRVLLIVFVLFSSLLCTSQSITEQFQTRILGQNLKQEDIDSIIKEKEKQKETSQQNKKDTLVKLNPVKEVVPVSSKEVKPEEPLELSFFGGDYFQRNNLINDNSNFSNPPQDYILGVGDEISVNIWGYTEFSGSFRIGSDGAIFAPNVGKVFLKGLSYESALRVVKGQFGKVYDLARSTIQINLVYSNSINVHVVGAVRNPKTYYLPSVNSVFNILSAAGLIEESNIREVEIIRNGKVIKKVDFYDYFMQGKEVKSVFLQNNDFVRVPLSNKRVTIQGEVRRPSKYEIKDSEDFSDLLSFAGGLTNKAYNKIVHLKRYNGLDYTVKDLSFDSLVSGALKLKLQDKDVVGISTLRQQLRKYVEVEGEVQVQGEYDLTSGLTVKKLLQKAGGVLPEAELSFINVIRQKGNGNREYLSFTYNEIMKDQNPSLILREFDKLVVYPKNKFSDQFYFKTYGAVRQPGKYEFSGKLTLEEAVNLSGGLNFSALKSKIEITRILNIEDVILDGDKAITETVYVNWEDKNERENTVISLLDRIYVRSIYGFGSKGNVKIQGEVKYPGVYSITKDNETLKEILERTGGVTENAFLEGGYIIREVDSIKGRMFLDLTELNKNKSIFNYVLRPGDNLFIPRKNNVVQLNGAITYKNVHDDNLIVPFKGKRSARHYIKHYAGGFSNQAKKKETIVIKSTGEVRRVKTYFWVIKDYPTVYPGSKVIVKTKPEKVKKERKQIDWNKSIQNFTSSVTGLAMTYILIQNLSN